MFHCTILKRWWGKLSKKRYMRIHALFMPLIYLLYDFDSKAWICIHGKICNDESSAYTF